jgi:hypothetical protein
MKNDLPLKRLNLTIAMAAKAPSTTETVAVQHAIFRLFNVASNIILFCANV